MVLLNIAALAVLLCVPPDKYDGRVWTFFWWVFVVLNAIVVLVEVLLLLAK